MGEEWREATGEFGLNGLLACLYYIHRGNALDCDEAGNKKREEKRRDETRREELDMGTPTVWITEFSQLGKGKGNEGKGKGQTLCSTHARLRTALVCLCVLIHMHTCTHASQHGRL